MCSLATLDEMCSIISSTSFSLSMSQISLTCLILIVYTRLSNMILPSVHFLLERKSLLIAHTHRRLEEEKAAQEEEEGAAKRNSGAPCGMTTQRRQLPFSYTYRPSSATNDICSSTRESHNHSSLLRILVSTTGWQTFHEHRPFHGISQSSACMIKCCAPCGEGVFAGKCINQLCYDLAMPLYKLP